MRNKTEKRVFWFDDGKRPNVADALEKEKDIVVHRLAFNGPPADIWGPFRTRRRIALPRPGRKCPSSTFAMRR